MLMDADDDCPAELAADLLKRAQSERSDLPIAVVVAAREFESWFIASADSLRERFSPGISIEVPANPESIRGAKEWLRDRLLNGKYAATVDQLSPAAKFDLRQARSASASFDKLWREMERVIANLEHR